MFLNIFLTRFLYRHPFSASTTIVAISLLFATSSFADYEGVTFDVGLYASSNPGEGRCCSNCSDLSTVDEYADSFFSGLQVIEYDVVAQSHNLGVDDADFSDNDWFPNWGADHVSTTGVDWADVAFYIGHGHHECDGTYYYSKYQMGENHGTQDGHTCAVRSADRTGSSNGHMTYGEGGSGEDLNALVLYTCEGVHYCVWQHGGYAPMDNGHFCILNGFHGVATAPAGDADDVWYYVVSSSTSGIGDNWIDSFFCSSCNGSYDRCPTSIIWGSSSTVRSNIFNYAGFKDFDDEGAHNGTTFFYISGCDPDNGEKL
jgi:hypothetical protein